MWLSKANPDCLLPAGLLASNLTCSITTAVKFSGFNNNHFITLHLKIVHLSKAQPGDSSAACAVALGHSGIH